MHKKGLYLKKKKKTHQFQVRSASVLVQPPVKALEAWNLCLKRPSYSLIVFFRHIPQKKTFGSVYTAVVSRKTCPSRLSRKHVRMMRRQPNTFGTAHALSSRGRCGQTQGLTNAVTRQRKTFCFAFTSGHFYNWDFQNWKFDLIHDSLWVLAVHSVTQHVSKTGAVDVYLHSTSNILAFFFVTQ